MNRYLAALIGLLAATAALGSPQVASSEPAAGDFADWTYVNPYNVAFGRLQDIPVTLSGSRVFPPPASVIDGTSSLFDQPAFTPPLPDSDAIEFGGFNPGYSYTLRFSGGARVTEPVLHLHSLGSTLAFPVGTQITKVSGDSGLTVLENTVSATGGTDVSGTVRLSGAFSAIPFTATTAVPVVQPDGIDIQVGAPPQLPDTTITDGPAEGAATRTRPSFSFTSTQSYSHYECRLTHLNYPPRTTAWRACSSPSPTLPTDLSESGYVIFEVRAINRRGLIDPTPARRKFFYEQPTDLSIDGIEVTQGVQEQECTGEGSCSAGVMVPDYIARSVGRNPAQPYQGVTLSTAKIVYARVYVQWNGEPDAATRAVVRLSAYDSNGASLGPAQLPSVTGEHIAKCCHRVSFNDRRNAAAAYTFLLPLEWSNHRSIRLRAEVTPDPGRRIIDRIPLDNSLEVYGIRVRQPAAIRVRPLRMDVRGIQPEPYPWRSFEGARATFPNSFEIPPYQGVVDATDAAQEPKSAKKSSMARELVEDWADDQGYKSGVYPYGLTPTGQGLDAGATKGDSRLYGDGAYSWAQSTGRPLTAVAHEMGHGLGLLHAGLKCGSNDGDQNGIPWPPDDEGRLAGFGLEYGAPYRVFGDDRGGPNYSTTANRYDGNAMWDLMSYCPGRKPPDSQDFAANLEKVHWLAPSTWYYLLNFRAPAQALPARSAGQARAAKNRAYAARSGRVFSLMAFLDDAGPVSILSLRRTTGVTTPSLAASPFHIVVRDAAGRALSDTGVAVTTSHTDPGTVARTLEAKVPAAGAASVQIVNGGKVVAERRRSAHSPRVKILSPRRKAKVRGRRTTLRWRASDADRDRLTISVDYSANGGRTWRTIFIGRNRGRTTLPTRLLSGSRNARLRVRANDGFNETARTSGRFSSAGAPPTVSIISPPRGTSIRADGTLVASADAFDDTGRRLGGRGLTWRLGRRIIGHGRQMSTFDLPAGRRRLTLSARDRRGQVGRASVAVRVVGVVPQFVVLQVPKSIKRTARSVRLTAATNVSATLRIGGRRFHVGRRVRTLKVRIRPGKGTLRLSAVLSAGGRRSTAALSISR